MNVLSTKLDEITPFISPVLSESQKKPPFFETVPCSPQIPRSDCTDFSVVLFRSDFVLFSEKNRVKAAKNQWVWIMPYHPERLSGATSRGQIMAPEVQKPSQ